MNDGIITINVNGTKFGGFKTVNINTSLEALCGALDFTHAFREDAFVILEGDFIQLFIDENLYLTGIVDTVKIGKTGSLIQIRSKTSLIVDSSPDVAKNELKNITFNSFLSELLSPFNSGKGLNTDIKFKIIDPIKKLYTEIKIGQETVFELINTKLKELNKRMVTTPSGDIEIMSSVPKKISTVIELGYNITDYNIEKSIEGRFSKYIVRSKNKTGKNKGEPWKIKAKKKSFFTRGEAIDKSVKFIKIKTIKAEDGLTSSECKKRAEYERDMRIGTTQEISVTLQGFYQTAKDLLWPLGALVNARFIKFDIDNFFIIKSLNLSKTDAGTFTDIILVPKISFFEG